MLLCLHFAEKKKIFDINDYEMPLLMQELCVTCRTVRADKVTLKLH